MNASELKYHVEQTGSHFFERSAMQFFGDRMSNYGVREASIITWTSETPVECWELYRRHPVKYGLDSSAYFDRVTLAHICPKK